MSICDQTVKSVDHSLALRPPNLVMRPRQIGAFYPTRLSFARTLLRQMVKEFWNIYPVCFDLDIYGVGTAIYRIDTQNQTVWFVAFANQINKEDRTDRVIAEKWDVTFTLTAFEPSTDELCRLRKNVPLQEKGRCSANQLILSRANKSVRLFEHVVCALSAGRQPDISKIIEVGYLLRTTAVYGNGKFGLAELNDLQNWEDFKSPFRAEMLTVYLARHFSFDWVEHIAKNRNPDMFIPLRKDIKSALGIGNATGLGMAPFLIKHPKLICNWIRIRERAIARVKALKTIKEHHFDRFQSLLARAGTHITQWNTADNRQQRRLENLATDLKLLKVFSSTLKRQYYWERLVKHSETTFSIECNELLNSLMIETNSALIDDLEITSFSREEIFLNPQMTIDCLVTLIARQYGWVREFDFSSLKETARFWYYSKEKQEPRIGWRFEEPGAKNEMRLAIARDVTELWGDLKTFKQQKCGDVVSTFLLQYPHWRQIIRRTQNLAACPYAEIRGNLIGADCRPIDLLRCKLSILGATKFDPKSELWTRVTFFQGAPLANDVKSGACDDWAFPVLDTSFEK